MADFPINVILDPTKASRGAAKVRKELGTIEKKATSAGDAIRRAIGFISVGLLVRSIVELTDTFTNLQNRLKLVTSSEENLIKVTRQLLAISNETRVSFESTATLFARVALSVKDLGISQQETLNFTKSLNQAVILSGASAREAGAGIIQLSQGLASGTLRGDELRSVLEMLPFVSDVIAKSLGVTRGELRLLGTDGKINAEVVLKAFREARVEIDEKFGKTIATIGQAFTILRGNITVFLGEFDKTRGISSAIAASIINLSENLETLARSVIAVSTALLVNYARTAIPAAVRATKAFTLALARNPLGAIAIAIAGIIGGLAGFGDQLKISENSIVTWGDRVQATFIVVRRVLGDFLEFTKDIFSALVETITIAFKGGLIDRLVLEPILDSLKIVQKQLILLTGRFADSVGITGIIDEIRRVELELAKERERNRNRAGDPDAGDPIDTIAKRKVLGEDAFIDLRQENALLVENDIVKRRLLEVEFKLEKKGVTLGIERQEQLRNLIEANEQFKIRRDLIDELVVNTDEFARSQSVLTDLFIEGVITQEQFIRKQRELNTTLLETSTTLEDGFKRGLLQVQQDLSDFASFAEESVTRAFQSGEDAIVEFARTGEFAFTGFIESVLEDLLRLIIRLQITIPLARSLSQALDNSGSSSIGNIFGNALGSLFGSSLGSAQTAAASVNTSTSAFLGPGFAHGGQFLVGGAGGTDSQNVQFRASPNEQVTIRTPAQQRESGQTVNVIVNNNSSKAEVETSQSTDPGGDLNIELLIVDIVADNINSGGKVARATGDFFGSAAAPFSRG